MHDVEDILNFWENKGLLRGAADPINLALLLHTQCRLNENTESDMTLKRCSIPALIHTSKEQPYLFTGLLDTRECVDTYRLGRIPCGPDVGVCRIISKRLLDFAAEMKKTIYFGGIVEQKGLLYLLTDQGD